MPQHDFSELFDLYPKLIRAMLVKRDKFDSHQFIIKLARDHQKEYVEALYSYRRSKYRGKDAPFKVVHGILAEQLTSHLDLIERVLPDVGAGSSRPLRQQRQRLSLEKTVGVGARSSRPICHLQSAI